jgi:hypothetical protein
MYNSCHVSPQPHQMVRRSTGQTKRASSGKTFPFHSQPHLQFFHASKLSKGCNSITGLPTQRTNKFDSHTISSRANSIYKSERPDEKQFKWKLYDCHTIHYFSIWSGEVSSKNMTFIEIMFVQSAKSLSIIQTNISTLTTKTVLIL